MLMCNSDDKTAFRMHECEVKKTKKQSAGEKDAVQANKKARRRRKTPETVLQWRAMRDSNLRPTGS